MYTSNTHSLASSLTLHPVKFLASPSILHYATSAIGTVTTRSITQSATFSGMHMSYYSSLGYFRDLYRECPITAYLVPSVTSHNTTGLMTSAAEAGSVNSTVSLVVAPQDKYSSASSTTTCTLCAKHFKSASALWNHVNSVHIF